MRAARALLALAVLALPATAVETSGPVFPGMPADAPATQPADAVPLQEQARNILKSAEFHEHQTQRQLVRRDWLRKLMQRRDHGSSAGAPAWNLAALAQAFQVIAVAVLALGLAWLLWVGWKWLAAGGVVRSPRPDGRLPLVPESLALSTVPLPVNVSAAASAAWASGNSALALSLLYRGAVRDLADRHRIPLPDSATEGECLRHARLSGKAVVGAGFAPIVQAWMALAYARRLPADFDALLMLYRQHFEAGTGEQT